MNTIMQYIKQISNRRTGEGLVLIFLIMNTVKITVFNMFMISSDTTGAFLYKAGFTFLLGIMVNMILLSKRSRIPFTVIYLIQDVYIFVNLAYYLYFHSYLHIYQAFALSSEGMGAARDLSIVMNPKMFIILLDLPFAFYIVTAYKGVIH